MASHDRNTGVMPVQQPGGARLPSPEDPHAPCSFSAPSRGHGRGGRRLARGGLCPARPRRRRVAERQRAGRPDLRRPRDRAGQDQARLADHHGEQVLRRDVHGAQHQHVPVEDAPEPGRAADELLRYGPLQPGQLHLARGRAGADHRHAGRLPAVHGRDGQGRHVRQSLLESELRAVRVRGQGERRARADGLRVPQVGPDGLQPARRRGRVVEGLCPGPDGRRRRHSGAQHRHSLLRRAVRDPGDDRGRLAPESGRRRRDRPVVPKHFPFPWFESLLQSPRDCNATHIADLFDPQTGLSITTSSTRRRPRR